jgi:hypothetical protein
MLLRNRPVQIDAAPATTATGYEQVPPSAIAVLRWLVANRVDFVLVGDVARSIRGDADATGPVAIVAAPYGRNLDRLVRALNSAHARMRVDGATSMAATGDGLPVRMTVEKLLSPQRWALRCGAHELDVEGHAPGRPRYQELLYEASRFELASELRIEVAAPEDVEYFDHVRRTGVPPEIRVARATRDPEPS